MPEELSSTAARRPRALPAGMRDLLPREARFFAELGQRLTRCFELFGYERVVVPAFEYTDVLERGIGTLDAREVLRFVEPESGEVVALRPDMTPQIARLVASRLGDAPLPLRLCYEGSVVRLRRERARRHRQIPQAGVELVGAAHPAGDVEVIAVMSAAVQQAGLSEYVLDLSHAGIAGALLSALPRAVRAPAMEALGVRDARGLGRLLAEAQVDSALARALGSLLSLVGDAAVWPEAERALSSTPAGPALAQLGTVFEAARAAGGRVLVDLGEVRHLAYYTGVTFQILAEGPGEAVASGGRYDALYARFGTGWPAAGFAVDLDNLAWALGWPRGNQVVRLLVSGSGAGEVLARLRGAGIVAAPAPEQDLDQYAMRWRYSHRVELGATSRLVRSKDQRVLLSSSEGPAEVVRQVIDQLKQETIR